MSASGSSSLRPAWSKGTSGGRGGFQPPPTVSERGDKARSASWGSQERNSSANKFAVLDDDDGPPPGMPGNGMSEDNKPAGNSRSEAFRSSFGRNSSTGNKPPGRSLADLAARVPEPPGGVGRRHGSFGAAAAAAATTGGAGVGGSSNSGRFTSRSSDAPNGGDSAYKPDPKVIRFTREKLLSMRQVPRETGLPDLLKELEGSPIVSTAPQDPVCWDTFDSEEIWETVRERSMARAAKTDAVAGPPRLTEATGDPRRRNTSTGGGGRWQRGVALPPPEEAARRKNNDNAENPDELWDDPVGGAIGAASDFSAFGAMPVEDEPFDFDKMAEATAKLDEEIHGSPQDVDADTDADADTEEAQLQKTVDTTRPLASVGTTIASGSGDNVNVFEDFDAPSADQPNEAETTVVRGATEDPSASSRLMAMIGVEPPKPDEGNANNGTAAGANPWGAGANPETSIPGIDPIFGSIGGLSLNPWGGAGGAASNAPDGGLDLAGRLGALAAEQKAREQQAEMEKRAQQEAELLRRRQDEEVQRRALAQRQADQARQQQAQAAAMQQQQQQASQQSQVELVLMERICSILENSWGRSDLVSILTTLHSEDSRVIPLLSNVDALRALIARSPQRVALRRDPSFSGDMAVLLVTNAQWQQQQQAQARQQEEELHRRRLEEEARAQAQSRASIQIKADLPWFYSDPQNNIQGPFRGEEMRQWLEAGYFKGDLPISQQSSGPFVPLSALFPDLNHAFKVPQGNADAEEAERKALEEEKRHREQAEEERRTAEARAAAKRQRAEAERQAAEAEAAAAAASRNASNDSDVGNQSSTQLKMMLGLSGAQNAEAETEVEAPAPAPPAPKKQGGEKKVSKGSKKSQPKPTEEAPVAQAPAPANPAAPVWGGAANAKPKKSMSEIQQEEARKAALLSAQGGGAPRQPSSGWANVAAGTQGWSSGVVKKTVAPAPNVVATNLRPSQTTRKSGEASSADVKKAPPLSQQQRASSTASASTPAEEFGATLSPTLEKWCKEQMEKLTGSDDLTLIGFCMTLTDANEIRQYLQAYLGTGAKVNSFATEFINKRGLGNNEQEEWETPGSAKKGRKKKTGAR